MATTTCVDCSAEVSSDDVRYVNGRQVCRDCAQRAGGGGSAPSLGHSWTRVLLLAGVATAIVAIGLPLVIRAIGVSSLLVLGAGGAVVGLAVRFAARGDTSAADRLVAAGFALGAAVVGDYLLFALEAPGGFAAAGNVNGWLDAVRSLGGIGAAMRFGIGPLIAFAVSGTND